MKRFTQFAVILAVVLTAFYAPKSFAMKMTKDKMMMHSGSGIALRMAMRELWTEHVVWTNHYIVSSLAGLPDTAAVADRLLRNQDDIGKAIKPYYGDTAGNRLTALLREHIIIATDVVKAAKAGNKGDLNAASNRWKVNADEIAVFLSSANPNWSKNRLMDMLQKHLALTTDEVVNRLKSNWTGYIEAYDKGAAHMMGLADDLTSGIIKQFPDKFKK